MTATIRLQLMQTKKKTVGTVLALPKDKFIRPSGDSLEGLFYQNKGLAGPWESIYELPEAQFWQKQSRQLKELRTP